MVTGRSYCQHHVFVFTQAGAVSWLHRLCVFSISVCFPKAMLRRLGASTTYTVHRAAVGDHFFLVDRTCQCIKSPTAHSLGTRELDPAQPLGGFIGVARLNRYRVIVVTFIAVTSFRLHLKISRAAVGWSDAETPCTRLHGEQFGWFPSLEPPSFSQVFLCWSPASRYEDAGNTGCGSPPQRHCRWEQTSSALCWPRMSRRPQRALGAMLQLEAQRPAALQQKSGSARHERCRSCVRVFKARLGLIGLVSAVHVADVCIII